MVKDVRVVDRKLKGLKEAVEVVEKNRSKFPHIKDVELQSRKQFVDSVQVVINGNFYPIILFTYSFIKYL